MKDVTITDGAISQGDDVLSFIDFLYTGLSLDDYEGQTGNATGLFGASWGAQFYPAAADFFEPTGDTTSISTSLNEKGNMKDVKAYDLQGRRLSNGSLNKGVYVVGGKKIIVK